MDERAVVRFITGTFDGVETQTVDENTFFFYGAERMFPFATLMTNDLNDDASNLDRAGVYRLNIGVGKQTFRQLFGETSAGGYDWTALDRVMPHPVYGMMYWVCVLNPDPTTWEQQVRPLLTEAYERDVAKHAKRAARS
jgi:hypothetical protein